MGNEKHGYELLGPVLMKSERAQIVVESKEGLLFYRDLQHVYRDLEAIDIEDEEYGEAFTYDGIPVSIQTQMVTIGRIWRREQAEPLIQVESSAGRQFSVLASLLSRYLGKDDGCEDDLRELWRRAVQLYGLS